MAAPHQITRLAMEVFGETEDVVVPRLIHELKAPYRVAALFPVAPNAISRWLKVRGWKYIDKEWVAPDQEPTHV